MAQQPNTTKSANKTAAPKVAVEKVAVERVDTRVAYTESSEASSAGIINADGKITGKVTDFNYQKHRAPKRVDFADEADFYEFKAEVYDINADRFAKRAVSCRENAATMRKFGDPAQRALVRRRQKLQEMMAELDAQLMADGISLDGM